jgi:ligand-binding SRPBCC domain-containing protein
MGLTYSSVIDASQDEVFSWHTRPGAVTRLLPPWQPVRVLHEAGSLRDGRATLTLPGGLRWVATHQPDAYDPPNSFADSLTSLPLPWRHTHQFSPSGNAATLMTDVIETPLPARALRSMLVYRHRQLAADLAALARARDISQDKLTVAVTGSSGLIGTALTALLTTSGHRVIPLVRRLPRIGERYWRPEDPAAELLDGVDAVIHLAGASIGGRFTPERKNEIRASRILPTRLLAELTAATPGLRAFVTASAIGIYGPDRGEEVLTETSPRGEGFLRAAACCACSARCSRPASAAGSAPASSGWPGSP